MRKPKATIYTLCFLDNIFRNYESKVIVYHHILFFFILNILEFIAI